MLLISLMLAAAPTSAVKPNPDIVQRREASRARPATAFNRSKRLIELEAAVHSLPLASADEQDHASGPKGM